MKVILKTQNLKLGLKVLGLGLGLGLGLFRFSSPRLLSSSRSTCLSFNSGTSSTCLSFLLHQEPHPPSHRSLEYLSSTSYGLPFLPTYYHRQSSD